MTSKQAKELIAKADARDRREAVKSVIGEALAVIGIFGLAIAVLVII